MLLAYGKNNIIMSMIIDKTFKLWYAVYTDGKYRRYMRKGNMHAYRQQTDTRSWVGNKKGDLPYAGFGALLCPRRLRGTVARGANLGRVEHG